MALRLAPNSITQDPAGSWPLPATPLFARPAAYYRLINDLRRFAQDELTGRSYLIAGHRGAGKTTMVLQAIRQMRDKALFASVNTPEDLFGRQSRPQRPLVVKIVGRSLIEPLALTKEEIAQAEKEGVDATQGQQAMASAALVRLTIALYRALAREVAAAAALHATADTSLHGPRRREVAAQLALVLDAEPDAGQLRHYWKMLGRLDRGLLWPPEAFAPEKAGEKADIVRRHMIDQGYREIVAVATAAQAFQICAGQITYKRTDDQEATNQAQLTAATRMSELVSRVAVLFAGTAAGATIAATSTVPVGLGAGVLVWLLGTVTMTFSATRTRNRTQKLDFTFLRDRSIQTLDRELPLMIDRIRDAGLAPVFVIDELDKLDRLDR
jgi:hypothetical protein